MANIGPRGGPTIKTLLVQNPAFLMRRVAVARWTIPNTLPVILGRLANRSQPRASAASWSRLIPWTSGSACLCTCRHSDPSRRKTQVTRSDKSWSGRPPTWACCRSITTNTTRSPDHPGAHRAGSGRSGRSRGTEQMENLTPREVEVLRLLSQGQTNPQIAQNLLVSLGTVKIHVQHIISKLGVSDRTQAAVRAIEAGLLGAGTRR